MNPRLVNSPATGGRLLRFDLLSHIYTLILPHTADELSNKKHISLALLVTELWISKVDDYLSKILLKLQVISSCSYWNVSSVPILMKFKTVLDNCLYIGVDIFAKNNFVSYLKRNFTPVWYKFRKWTIITVSPSYSFWSIDSTGTQSFNTNTSGSAFFMWLSLFYIEVNPNSIRGYQTFW